MVKANIVRRTVDVPAPYEVIHVMEWVEILSLVWGVVGLVFFIQLMETLGGLF